MTGRGPPLTCAVVTRVAAPLLLFSDRDGRLWSNAPFASLVAVRDGSEPSQIAHVFTGLPPGTTVRR